MSNRVSSSDMWISCIKCPLSESRRNVVLRDWGRVRNGSVDRSGSSLYYIRSPSTEKEPGLIQIEQGPFILFIGEAPGNHEDITGLPFQGRAGFIFNWCLSLCHTTFHFEVTNIIACRPTKWGISTFSVVNRTPDSIEIAACLPRLTELTDDVTYDAIVYLGATAREFSAPKGLSSLSLQHPAKILREEYKWYHVKEFALLLDRFVEKI